MELKQGVIQNLIEIDIKDSEEKQIGNALFLFKPKEEGDAKPHEPKQKRDKKIEMRNQLQYQMLALMWLSSGGTIYAYEPNP